MDESASEKLVTLPKPLVAGILIRRYKRFLADVRLPDGSTVAAHCPNPGRLQGLNQEGTEVRLSRARNPGRKLNYTWELARAGAGGVWVGVNTLRANEIAARGIETGAIAELSGYPSIQREVKTLKSSRIDIKLSGRGPDCYVEVKNVTLVIAGTAYFPDAVTSRGKRHMEVLSELKDRGNRAAVLFTVQRSDAERFSPEDEIDPEYGKALRRAIERGVELYAYQAAVDEVGISITGPIPACL